MRELCEAIAAATIMMGTHGGQAVVPVDCFGMKSLNYHITLHLPDNNITYGVLSSHGKGKTWKMTMIAELQRCKIWR